MHIPVRGNSTLLKRRFLPREGESPALEVIEVETGADKDAPPILCVHGASGGAWMWEKFLQVLAARGRRASAISVRGHGQSEGHSAIQSATLEDYICDLLRALAEFDESPILVAHSLGSLLVQRLLGRVRMQALVLIAPLPPEGMFLLSPRLIAMKPSSWCEGINMVLGGEPPVLGSLKDLIFSERFTSAEINWCTERMVAESARALMEAHVPQLVTPAFLAAVPTMIIGGELDRLVPADFVWRTAIYHGGHYVTAEGFGHLLHVEPGGEEIACLTIDWLEKRGL
jgi:pimeloyl-ACP methyl ester carboxylesterase